MAGQLWIVGHGRTVMDCWRWQAVMDCWTWQAAQPEMQMTLVGAAPHMRVGAADHDRPKTTTELGTERCQTLKTVLDSVLGATRQAVRDVPRNSVLIGASSMGY